MGALKKEEKGISDEIKNEEKRVAKEIKKEEKRLARKVHRIRNLIISILLTSLPILVLPFVYVLLGGTHLPSANVTFVNQTLQAPINLMIVGANNVTLPNNAALNASNGARSLTVLMPTAVNRTVQRTELYVDNNHAASIYSSPFFYNINTNNMIPGSNNITAISYDGSGHIVHEKTITIFVNKLLPSHGPPPLLKNFAGQGTTQGTSTITESLFVPPLSHAQRLLFATSGSNYYWVGAESYATSALTNTGISGVIQVYSTQITGCLSYWVADEMLSNSVWGQVGYYICNGSTPVAFYQIWSNGAVATTGTTSVSPGQHTFSMYQESGSTWAYALDGQVFGTYSMGSNSSSSSYPDEALSEEGYVSSSWNPPYGQISQIQVREQGAWTQIATGYEPYGCSSASYSCWGAQGHIQNLTIPNYTVAIGGSTPIILGGTTLWNSIATTSTTISTTTASTTSTASTSLSTSVSSTTIPTTSVNATSTVPTSITSISTTSSLTTSLTTTTLPTTSLSTTTQSTTIPSTTTTVPPAPPSIAITSPVNGTMVVGKVNITATASDKIGVKNVTFYIDGNLKLVAYTPPYYYIWQSQGAKRGTHTITAVAYDFSGLFNQTSITVKK